MVQHLNLANREGAELLSMEHGSLEDKKSGGSNYSGDTLKVSKQRSKNGKEPYRLSTQNFTRFECEGDGIGNDRSMELRPVETLVNKHNSSQAGESQTSRVAE